MKRHYYTDPGHGWLKVPRKQALGLSISAFSYQRGDWVYLEEDCDMPKYVSRYPDTTVYAHHANRASKIRNYESFKESE